MKKIIITILLGLALLSFLFMFPTMTLTVNENFSNGDQYSSIVPAKPPKVPPKEVE